jgi:hypothetical protein
MWIESETASKAVERRLICDDCRYRAAQMRSQAERVRREAAVQREQARQQLQRLAALWPAAESVEREHERLIQEIEATVPRPTGRQRPSEQLPGGWAAALLSPRERGEFLLSLAIAEEFAEARQFAAGYSLLAAGFRSARCACRRGHSWGWALRRGYSEALRSYVARHGVL